MTSLSCYPASQFYSAFPLNRFRKRLIIDDDPASRYLNTIILEDMQLAQQVDSLPDAQQAITHLQQCCLDEQSASEQLPDWILLDFNMPMDHNDPFMDGFEFLAQLEALKKKHTIYTIITIVSSSHYSKDKERAAQYPVKGYLIKPLTEGSILEWMDQYLME